MKAISILLILSALISGCSLFEDQTRYSRPRVDVGPYSSRVEVPSGICDIIDANIHLGSVSLESFSGRCGVRTTNYR